MSLLWILSFPAAAAAAASVAFTVRYLRRLRLPPAADRLRSDILYERCCRYLRSSKAFRNPDLDRQALADALYTNQVYLSRTINHHAGTSVPHFINRFRVRYAMERFRADPSLSVRILAEEAGFANPSTFNNAFKRMTGESPSVWCARVKRRNKYFRAEAEIKD